MPTRQRRRSMSSRMWRRLHSAEGCAVVHRARSSSELLMLGHGRVVHGRAVRAVRIYSKLSSGMHCTVESHAGKSCGQEKVPQHINTCTELFSVLKVFWF